MFELDDLKKKRNEDQTLIKLLKVELRKVTQSGNKNNKSMSESRIYDIMESSEELK